MVTTAVSGRVGDAAYQGRFWQCPGFSSHKFSWARIIWRSIVLCSLIVPLAIRVADAQTFNEAITRQLAATLLGGPPATSGLGCDVLVGNSGRDPGTGLPDDFGTELANICGPFVPPGGPGSFVPNATGGSGATPITADVEKRLREFHEGKQETAPRFSVFLTAPDYKHLNRDTTRFEDGYKSHIFGGTLGADVLINNSWIAGLAFNYKRWDGRFRSGGNFDTNIYSPIVYASFSPLKAFFSDIVFSYSRKEVSSDRSRSYVREDDQTFGGNVSSNPGENEFKLNVSLGYDYPFGQFTVGPRVGLDFIHTRFESYSEKGKSGLELRYDSESKTSFQSKLGLQASMAISTPFGVVTPQLSGDWVHEYADNQRRIRVRFVQDLRPNPKKFSFQSDTTDRNFFEIGTGIVAVLPHGLQPFINFRTLVGHTFLDSQSVTGGLRVEF